MRKLIFILLALIVTGCATNNKISKSRASNPAGSDGKLRVVTTIFPPYDFTRAIAGDRADTTMLISPGATVHSFDPSPADMKTIANADVFIYIGGESDGWVDRILESIDITNKKLVRLIAYVDAVEEEFIEGMEPEEEANEDELPYDEHIWTSPQNAVKMINAIADSLCAADSENAAFYRQNAGSYIDDIQKVGNEIDSIVKNAKRNKIVVADKFPFRYLVEAYGLEYCAAFAACSDQTDASVATIAYLVDTVKKEEIPYVYYVEFSTQNVANALSEQTGAGTLLLHSGHNISKSDYEAGVTYLSLMKQNAESLRTGLN